MTTKTKTARAVAMLPGQPAAVLENFDVSLEGLQRFVGGYIEAVHLGGSVVAIVHEEGLLEGLPWTVQLPGCNPFAGPVVLLSEGPDGEFSDLPGSLALQAVELMDAHRLDPTPSSLDDFERMTGRPAIAFVSW